MNKTIRIWDGCTVVGLLSVDQHAGSVFSGGIGGAANSTVADIEIDPWKGLIVDHDTDNPPFLYRESQS